MAEVESKLSAATSIGLDTIVIFDPVHHRYVACLVSPDGKRLGSIQGEAKDSASFMDDPEPIRREAVEALRRRVMKLLDAA